MGFIKIRLLFVLLIGLVATSVLALGQSPAARARVKSAEEIMSPESYYKAVVTRGQSLVVTEVTTAKTVIDFGAYAKGVYFLGNIDHLVVVFYASWLDDSPTSFAVYDLLKKRFYIAKVECCAPIFMSKTGLEMGRYLDLSFLLLTPGSFSRYDLENKCWVKHAPNLVELHAQREARHKIYRVLGWSALAMGVGLVLKKLG